MINELDNKSEETKTEVTPDLNHDSNKDEAIGEQLSHLKPIEASPAHDFFDFLFELLKTGVIVVIFALLIRYFAIQPFIVDGSSMLPNYTDKEYLLAEKISYLIGDPGRGDVIVFQYPKNPSLNYIKRIIGLPGETVEINNDQIKVINSAHPNGLILTETYIPKDSLTEVTQANGLKVTLKDNEFFVLGDNREHSSDSREWGILPRSNILGRSWLSIAKLNSSIPKLYFKIHNHISY